MLSCWVQAAQGKWGGCIQGPNGLVTVLVNVNDLLISDWSETEPQTATSYCDRRTFVDVCYH